ncbi:MAG: hypothetical protein VX642_12440, partial [Bdellovibrionota bacterium]|nr:hypothetical protein [Bdellovibrionota bacterium]
MNLKSLVIAPVLLSMIACSKDKVTNSPNSQDKVALELSAVKAENLENQLDSLQRIIFSGNMETTEVVYKALQKLEVSYPDDSRIKFYLKLIKPMLLAKGIHRKMDHLVYMAEGDAGLWDHINDLRKRSDARFLRNAKKEEVFKTEKQAQELVDKIADSYGDLFQFAKKIESSSVELLMPQSKCDNEYYTVAYWKYDDELEYGRDYFVRGFKKGYGYKKSSESSDKGEWFYSDTKESILSKISRYEAKLTEIEGEIENAEEGVELDRLEDNLKYYKKELANAQAMLNREEGEYLTDRVYQSGVCVSSSYKYKMEKLDWKY